MRMPEWVCETHLREIEELETSGEISESKVRASEIVNEYLWCNDCKDIKHGEQIEKTKVWEFYARLGEMI
jgi:Ribonuclease G/E